MKYVAVIGVWMSYAGMVTATAFWTDGFVVTMVAIFGGLFAMLATAFLALPWSESDDDKPEQK